MPNVPSANFTIKANGIARDIRTPVQISIAFDPAIKPHPEAKQFTAIWDTGATGSVITKKVADDCGLKPFTVAPVRTAAGQHTSPVYLINVSLPNNVGIANVRATEGILSDSVDVLIGMDIISTGDFALTHHEGKSAFSFRFPSCECIDFVKQAKAAKTYTAPTTPGRNSPCPCGSGLKYKKCHGKQ